MVVANIVARWSYFKWCTSTMFCIWPDDGSMSRNMWQNF